MQHKPVKDALQAHFDIDARKLEFISRFIIALLKVRSVNLTQIATALNGFAKLESNARRVKRFLNVDFAQEMIARFVLSFTTGDKIVLTMDHTNWQFGAAHINSLVIGIAHNGIALPSDTVLRQRLRAAPAWVWFNTLKQGEIKELGKAKVMGIRVWAILVKFALKRLKHFL